MASIFSLLTPEKMSEHLKGMVSAKRLVELAESRLIPHYTVEDAVYFDAVQVGSWVDHNLVIEHEGRNISNGIATIINVVAPAIDSMTIPLELRAVANLLIPMELESLESPPIVGVYFLCSKGKVVYVGQSVNVVRRIGSHFGQKTFDAVFLLRVPQSDLGAVEGAFIQQIKPVYNKAGIIGNNRVVWSEKQRALMTLTGTISESPEEELSTM